MPLITCELRWFFEGPLPDEVGDWLARGRPTVEPWREDRYLVLPGVADMGIKARGGRIEIKGRTAELGSHSVAPGIEGVAERWCKWSYQAGFEDAFRGAATILVAKARAQRHFLFDGDGARQTAARDLTRGFSIELTRLRLGGADHWTLGIEAAPDDAALLTDLLRTLPDLLDSFPRALPAACAKSYPAWLL